MIVGKILTVSNLNKIYSIVRNYKNIKFYSKEIKTKKEKTDFKVEKKKDGLIEIPTTPKEPAGARHMPTDIVLVRHGESEGNVYLRKSNHSFKETFINRPTSLWRLTKKGREQANTTGDWIKKNISSQFYRYYTSEYLRAMETAALFNIPNAHWLTATYLRERDWGQFELLTNEERWERFRLEMMRRKRDSFYFAPPGGESMAQVLVRVDHVLSILHSECSHKKILIVSHGEVISAFMIRLEKISQIQYKEFCESHKTEPHRLLNYCQVVHYTRINPETKQISPNLKWVRSVCPWNIKKSDLNWREFGRTFYTNEKILEVVSKYPPLIDSEEDDLEDDLEDDS
ncbi:phosphoglycerate mutase family protein [Anaeramoeba ignava]|uniref:phosphoglycerate mutase (2,3-diphosphoglycerate-dependent) n=1 Tax=Anaeramoeba ignava TaxID=1746090 RepID=A0A9Q0LV49_ANAIG|nr:phosphoglycerate mutase family protein [Anaeramoeba ignava]